MYDTESMSNLWFYHPIVKQTCSLRVLSRKSSPLKHREIVKSMRKHCCPLLQKAGGLHEFRCTQIFLQPRSLLETLGTRRATWSKHRTVDPQIRRSGTELSRSGDQVHPCYNCRHISTVYNTWLHRNALYVYGVYIVASRETQCLTLREQHRLSGECSTRGCCGRYRSLRATR